MTRLVAVEEIAAGSLFERIGGRRFIRHLVDRFYQRLWNDATLTAWLAHVDPAALKPAQTAFFVEAFGGPDASDTSSEGDLRLELEPLLRVARHLHDTVMSLGLGEETAHDLLHAIVTQSLRR